MKDKRGVIEKKRGGQKPLLLLLRLLSLTVPKPTENRKHNPIRLSMLACKPRMMGMGMRKIQMSVARLMLFVA